MIETTHQGYAIQYSENEDCWRCYDLNLTDTKLSGMRNRINKVLADQRRLENVSVFVLSGWMGDRVRAAQATLLDGEGVWVLSKEGKTMRRRKEGLGSIVIDTPENREAIVAWREQAEKVRHEQEVERKMLAAIPRATVEDLRNIKRDAA